MIEEKELKKKIKRTKSFLFIFPMLSDTINDFLDNETKELRKGGQKIDLPLLNCYIGDVDKPHYKNHIFILYDWIKSKDFSIFEQSLSKHPFFVEMYDPTPKHVMFVFSVPDDFKLEYELFKSERPKIYRRFSNQYKEQILSFLDPVMELKSIENILYSKDYIDSKGKEHKIVGHEERFLELEKMIGQKIPRDIDNYAIPNIEQETFNKERML